MSDRWQRVSHSRRRLHCIVVRRSSLPSTPAVPAAVAPIALDASGQEVMDLLRAHFPVAHMDMIAAYGSGAFVQIADSGEQADAATAVPGTPHAAASSNNNMLDLIFAVPDPLAFHRENMTRNPSHYSGLRWFAHCWPGLIRWVQESGAGVWYNTLIQLEIPASAAASASSSSSAAAPATRLVKYGVISRSRLVSDLECWSDLYIAGRMHKPMHILLCSEEVRRAARTNLQSACSTALLLIEAQREAVAEASAAAAVSKPTATASPAIAAAAVAVPVAPPSPVSPRVVPLPSSSLAPPSSSSPSVVPLRTLLRTIAALSYSGDVRMGLAENPHKVANIVAGSWRELVALYAPVIARVLRESSGAAPPTGAIADAATPDSAAAAATASSTASHPTDVIDFECDVARRTRMLGALPAHFQEQILKSEATHPLTHHLPVTSGAKPDALPTLPPPTWRRVALLPAAQRHLVLSTALSRIVRRSSSQQTIKGLATAGVSKSVQYALAKVRKAFRK